MENEEALAECLITGLKARVLEVTEANGYTMPLRTIIEALSYVLASAIAGVSEQSKRNEITRHVKLFLDEAVDKLRENGDHPRTMERGMLQ